MQGESRPSPHFKGTAGESKGGPHVLTTHAVGRSDFSLGTVSTSQET